MKGSIDISGLNEALGAIRRLSGDLPGKVVADALSHTAAQARKALQADIRSVFDRPTILTVDSVKVLQAKAPTLEAAVWINDRPVSGGLAPERWLKAEVFGGARADKRLEKALRARGILPAGRYVAPGKGARLDAYGNITRTHAREILEGLDLFGVYARQGIKRKRGPSKAAPKYFVLRRGRAAIGIAERRGKQMAVVLAFVSPPQYTQRLGFEDAVHRVADRELLTNIDLAIAKALG